MSRETCDARAGRGHQLPQVVAVDAARQEAAAAGRGVARPGPADEVLRVVGERAHPPRRRVEEVAWVGCPIGQAGDRTRRARRRASRAGRRRGRGARRRPRRRSPRRRRRLRARTRTAPLEPSARAARLQRGTRRPSPCGRVDSSARAARGGAGRVRGEPRASAATREVTSARAGAIRAAWPPASASTSTR